MEALQLIERTLAHAAKLKSLEAEVEVRSAWDSKYLDSLDADARKNTEGQVLDRFAFAWKDNLFAYRVEGLYTSKDARGTRTMMEVVNGREMRTFNGPSPGSKLVGKESQASIVEDPGLGSLPGLLDFGFRARSTPLEQAIRSGEFQLKSTRQHEEWGTLITMKAKRPGSKLREIEIAVDRGPIIVRSQIQSPTGVLSSEWTTLELTQVDGITLASKGKAWYINSAGRKMKDDQFTFTNIRVNQADQKDFEIPYPEGTVIHNRITGQVTEVGAPNAGLILGGLALIALAAATLIPLRWLRSRA